MIKEHLIVVPLLKLLKIQYNVNAVSYELLYYCTNQVMDSVKNFVAGGYLLDEL